jgi:hypothetical protein
LIEETVNIHNLLVSWHNWQLVDQSVGKAHYNDQHQLQRVQERRNLSLKPNAQACDSLRLVGQQKDLSFLDAPAKNGHRKVHNGIARKEEYEGEKVIEYLYDQENFILGLLGNYVNLSSPKAGTAFFNSVIISLQTIAFTSSPTSLLRLGNTNVWYSSGVNSD